MYHRLLTIAELVLFFDHGLTLGRAPPLFDNRCPVAISVAVFVRLTNGYSGADRANTNANIIS
jgi:hypothetical protein